MVSVIVLVDEDVFRKNVNTFLRELGTLLRTKVHVKQDELGNDMIYPWKMDSGLYVPGHGVSSGSFAKGGSGGTIVYLEIDNRKCLVSEGSECFSTADEVCYKLPILKSFLKFL